MNEHRIGVVMGTYFLHFALGRLLIARLGAGKFGYIQARADAASFFHL